jgi:WD40 repeat protein
VVPLAAAAAVAAAACAPVVWPLLVAAGAGSGAAAVAAALSQVGGVGGGLLSEAVIRAWDRLRSRGRPEAGQAYLRDALAAELQAGLTLGTASAAGLRGEVAGVLRRVDAVQVALTATVEESAAGVRDMLVRGLRELGEEFAEFGWVLDEVSRQLTVIAEDVARTAATTREVADNQQQTLVELALLRREARSAFRSRADRPGGAVAAGPSADEERAAALDAAGVPVSAHCPYPGLAAFQPGDAGRFFGREQLTAELVARAGEQLARPGLLMVLGPSGSGKSSVLRAGLLPAVAAGALPARGSWAWPRDLMTPGRRPLLELATRIASLAGIPAGGLEADLRTDPARITGAIRQALLTNARRQAAAPALAPAADPVLIELEAGQQAEEQDHRSLADEPPAAAGPRLMLIVDQFEEVFTQCKDEQERRAFIKALCVAAGTPALGLTADGPARGQVDARQAPALVVIGLRADFYARCTAYPELVPHLQDHQVLVGPIDEAGLREVIEKPAATAGLAVDAALVEILLADLGLHARTDATAATGWDSYAVGRLALLSYALQQTWRNREGRRLTVAGYRATGGIDGAVAQAADDVYNRLDPAGRETVHRVLLRLITLGEGTPDSRRRVDLAELTGSEDGERATPIRAVLADLIDARLVTADADAVEITHETLLTAWPRLRMWLTEDRAGLRIHMDLTDAAREWQNEGRDPGRLFRGTRLAVARDWAAHHDQDLNPGERAFLTASQHDQLRATRRRRAAAAALAVLTVLSLTAAGIAIQQRGNAVRDRDQAIANQIAVEAGELATTNPSLAAQLDVVANQIFSTSDSETRLIDTTTTPLVSSLATSGANYVSSLAFSPIGRTLAEGRGDGQVLLWNMADLAHPTQLSRLLTGASSLVFSVAFSTDGRTLASGVGDGSGQLWLWNVTDPAHPTLLSRLLTGRVGPVAFSRDGRTLAAGTDDAVFLWTVADPAHPTLLSRLLTGAAAAHTLAFSPNGRTLAVGNDFGQVVLLNVAGPAHPTQLGQPLKGLPGPVASVAFSTDGRTLAAGAADEVLLWNMADPAHPTGLGQPLTGPADNVNSVAFSPDGQTLAAGTSTAAGGDGVVWLWNVADRAHPTQLSEPPTPGGGFVNSVAFSPDGQTLAAGNDDGVIWLWNRPPTTLVGPTDSVYSVAFSPDGRTLAAGPGTADFWLWNLADPTHPIRRSHPLLPSKAGGPYITSNWVAFSPDGRTLAANITSGQGILLWNVSDPARPTQLGLPLPNTESGGIVTFSLHRRFMAFGAEGGSGEGVLLWNVSDPAYPTILGQPLTGPALDASSLAFSPDGRILAVGTSPEDGIGKVWLWNLADPARPIRLSQPLTGPTTPVNSVAFSPDGQTLAAGTGGGKVWLWNLANPARPTSLGQPLTGPALSVNSVAFSPDGQTLAVGTDDDDVWLWNLANPARPTSLGQPLTGPTSSVNSVAFSPDGQTLAAGTDDGDVWLWNLDVDKAIQRVCVVVGSLTRAQWDQYVSSQLPYDPPCAHPGRYGLLVH